MNILFLILILTSNLIIANDRYIDIDRVDRHRSAKAKLLLPEEPNYGELNESKICKKFNNWCC